MPGVRCCVGRKLGSNEEVPAPGNSMEPMCNQVGELSMMGWVGHSKTIPLGCPGDAQPLDVIKNPWGNLML